MNCFGFFHYIFSLFFTVLVVHPHHDHPVTTVLTHYSPMAWCSLFMLKLPLNTNQPTSLLYSGTDLTRTTGNLPWWLWRYGQTVFRLRNFRVERIYSIVTVYYRKASLGMQVMHVTLWQPLHSHAWVACWCFDEKFVPVLKTQSWRQGV